MSLVRTMGHPFSSVLNVIKNTKMRVRMERWTIRKINKSTEKRNGKGEWKASALNSPRTITSGLAGWGGCLSGLKWAVLLSCVTGVMSYFTLPRLVQDSSRKRQVLPREAAGAAGSFCSQSQRVARAIPLQEKSRWVERTEQRPASKVTSHTTKSTQGSGYTFQWLSWKKSK